MSPFVYGRESLAFGLREMLPRRPHWRIVWDAMAGEVRLLVFGPVDAAYRARADEVERAYVPMTMRLVVEERPAPAHDVDAMAWRVYRLGVGVVIDDPVPPLDRLVGPVDAARRDAEAAVLLDALLEAGILPEASGLEDVYAWAARAVW